MSISYSEFSQLKVQRNRAENGRQVEPKSPTTSAGPKGTGNPSKIELVQAMEAAAFSGHWEKFKSFLTDDVYYKVGNTAEVRGPQAIVAYMIKLLSTELAINDLQIRAAWETENEVILELNMKGLRMHDNRNVSYPCVDVYRFEGDKIRDWRVYPIEPTYIV
ncbi:MAG TPA: nuclear transport factor 2 family protein [Anaerolineae bacterium]|nr:nuclear transport factor 2 family protein [Anaerolineae bacterium]